MLAGEVDEQTSEASHLDSGHLAGGVAQQSHPFFGGKQGFFEVIVSDGDEDAVEEPSCPCDDVEVAVGHWIKAAWVNGGVPHGR